MDIKESTKLLAGRIRMINRYCGEDKAVKLVMTEFIDEFLKNPDLKYWERIKTEVPKL